MTRDFLIVGGGIGGAVLGELLARGGKDVLVLERSLGPPPWVRPEVLWPSTVRLLRTLLPAGAFETEAGLPLRGLALQRHGKELVSFSARTFAEAGVEPWSTNPNRTRELLLEAPSFELRRGLEVLRVLVDSGRVTGVAARDAATGEEQELTAEWTIGDDGAHSRIRQAAGIELRLKPFPLDFLCFGFDWPGSLPPAAGRAWLAGGPRGGIGGLLALPLPGGKGAGVVLARGEVLDDAPRVSQAWGRFISEDPRIAEVVGARSFPADFQRVRREWGHASRYGGRGALILGDAAQPVSPAGGQGANMSVADAAALAEAALRRPGDILDEYEGRRRAANGRSLRFTRIAHGGLTLPPWVGLGVILPFVLRWLGGFGSIQRRFLRLASTAFADESQAGSRACPAPTR